MVDAAVAGEGDVQLAVVPLAGEDDEDEGQDGHQQHVQDAEEDVAGRDADAVAAVRQTPGDGVQEPQEVDPARQEGVVSGNLDAPSRDCAAEESADGEKDPGSRAEGEETPLVLGGREGGDEVRDNPTLC